MSNGGLASDIWELTKRLSRFVITLACLAAAAIVIWAWHIGLENVHASRAQLLHVDRVVIRAEKSIEVGPEIALQPVEGVNRQTWRYRFTRSTIFDWEIAEITGRFGFRLRYSGGAANNGKGPPIPERRQESLHFLLPGIERVLVANTEGPDAAQRIDLEQLKLNDEKPDDFGRTLGRLKVMVKGAATQDDRTYFVSWTKGAGATVQEERPGATPDLRLCPARFDWYDISGWYREFQPVLPTPIVFVVKGVDGIIHNLRRWYDPYPTTTLVTLGGSVSCQGYAEASRIAAPELWGQTLSVVEQRGALYLTPGRRSNPSAYRAALATIVDDGRTKVRLASRAHGIKGELSNNEAVDKSKRNIRLVSRFTLGPTTYRIEHADAAMPNALVLVPVTNQTWVRSTDFGQLVSRLPANVAVGLVDGCAGNLPRRSAPTGSQIELRFTCLASARSGNTGSLHARWQGTRLAALLQQVSGAGNLILLLLAVAIVVHRIVPSQVFQGWWLAPARQSMFVAICGSVLMIAGSMVVKQQWPERAGQLGISIPEGMAIDIVLGLWAMASVVVIISMRETAVGSLLWLLVMAMAAVGSVTMAQLGYGSPGEKQIEYFQRTVPALALFAAGITICALIDKETLRTALSRIAFPQIGRRWSWIGRQMPIWLIWAALAIWVIWGSDEGISRVIQPSEYIKVGALYAISLLIVTCYTNLVVLPGEASFSRAFWLVVHMAILFGFMVVVPAIRHDYSPLLIIVLTTLFVGTLGCATALLNGLFVRGEQRKPSRIPLQVFGMKAVPAGERSLQVRMRRLNKQPLLQALPSLLWMLLRGLLSGSFHFITRNFFFAVLFVAAAGAYVADSWRQSWPGLSASATIEQVVASIAQADQRRGESMTKFYGRLMSYFDLRMDRTEEDGRVRIIFADEGQQVRASRKAIASAPCRPPPLDIEIPVVSSGARAAVDHLASWICRQPSTVAPALGETNAHVLHEIPVLQSDFIGAFLIGRFGVVTAFIVALMQLLVVIIAIGVGLTTYRGDPGPERDRAKRHLLSLMCIGGGTLLALQWLISWCNVLGLLPVMGQPMSFIAYASSNTVLLVLPIVALLLTAIRLDREEWARPLGSRPPPIKDWI